MAIEVKFGKNKAPKEQIEFLELVANAGGVGLLVYDVQFIASVLVTIDDDPITPLPLSEALLWTVKEPNRLFVGGIK